MTKDQIIAYVRGTTEFESLVDSEKKAVADGDSNVLTSILKGRIDALEQTDTTQADSVRQILRDLNAL